MFGRKKTDDLKGKNIVVRVYEHRKPKELAKLFETDAQKMDAAGFDIVSVNGGGDNKTALTLLTGGVGLLAKGSITVTYRRRAAAA